jgi:lipoprotein-anchoring transpeptidase ErfK/SrfK
VPSDRTLDLADGCAPALAVGAACRRRVRLLSSPMRRPLTLLLLTLSVLAWAATSAGAQTPPAPDERIRAGVTVAGIDVGNLTVPEATARLDQTLGPVLAQDVVVAVAGKRFALKMAGIKFRFRADSTALRALYAGRAAPPAPDGSLPPASATPSVSYKRKPVWRFVRRTAKKVNVAPRNARVKITLTRMIKRPGKKGRALAVEPVVKAIQAAVADPAAVREIAPKLARVTPKIRTKELKKAYPAIITIDRDHFRLRLFKRLKFVKGYGVAVGQPGYPTPTGQFAVQSKQVNPVWTAPNSPWAGEMAGQSVSGGAANNPLKARWIGVAGSVGIHGTGEPWTIGTQASHGCIRMTVPDVIDLFGRISLGTPVMIG